MGDEYDYFCGYDLRTGRNAHYGAPLKIKKGDPVPPPAPGTGLRAVSGTWPCGEDQCTGPLAPILEGFWDLLPTAWRPGVPAAQLENFNRINQSYLERRNSRLRPLPPRTPRPPGPPTSINAGYCCLCGETGLCFTTGGDCRFLPVLQRRHGQC